MKKIIALALTILMLAGTTGCSQNTTTPETPSGQTSGGEANSEGEKSDLTLEEMMEALLADVNIEMATVNTEITDERFSWFFDVEPIEGAKALASEAMMNSIAHYIALLELPEGVDVAQTATDIEGKLDPRKWICVEAEKSIVKYSGNRILVIMSTTDIADQVAANFDAL